MSKIIFNGVDYAGGSGNYFNPVIYSDTERTIGVWRDNKPLYKKTFHFNSTVWINANGWTNGINVDTTDVETLVDAEVLRTIGAYSFYGYLQVVPYNNLLNIFNCRNTNMEIDTITLYYTKISDVAGSGDYNTYGVPTVHYSTSEQVIGTWNDKPLYQKTLSIPSLPNNTATEYTILNTAVFREMTGYIQFVSGNKATIPYISESLTQADNIFFQMQANGSIKCQTYKDRSNCSAEITVKYTKSTD